MTANLLESQPNSDGNSPRWRRGIIIAAIIFGAVIIVQGVVAMYAYSYRDRVYPGVFLGNHHLGGLTSQQAQELFESFNNRYSKEGIPLTLTDASGTLHSLSLPVVSNDDSSIELISLDGAATAKSATTIGRRGNWFQRLWAPALHRFTKQQVSAVVRSNTGQLNGALHDVLGVFEDTFRNGGITILNGDPRRYEIQSEKSGWKIEYTAVAQSIHDQVGRGVFTPVAVPLVAFTPAITRSDVESVIPELPVVIGYGPLSLNYVDPKTSEPMEWSIKPIEFGTWLEVRKDDTGKAIIALQPERVTAYIEKKIRPNIDEPAQEAKFVMNTSTSRVEEFQASKTGWLVNAEKTTADLDAAFRERNYHPEQPLKAIIVSVDIVEPVIKTADVNDLGITQIVGVGTSTFYGSPPNRIRNITTASKRLHGVIVKPGEEFSTNKSAGPYIPENGYLPELVIKGKEIKKEVGGGMCRIGTTLFRMAMNSGMPITERRNHSLVVNYYSDPINHKPGTDATVYDPLIGFKFLNDTGGYLLVQTEVDYKKQLLTYTLWGTPDGRQGWYSRPVVSQWFPPGEKQIIETDKLAPGVRECQHAYTGARASFTYTRITTSTEKIERVFDSYYRPLPEICLVGKAVASSTATTVGELGDPGD